MAEASLSRPFLLGAGLKMYLGHAETVRWVAAVREACAGHPAVVSGRAELLVLPGFVSIEAVVRELAGSTIAVGAQDVSDQARGPFTGETSAADLAAVGCRYVEIGHAERRARHGETDAVVAAKTARTVAAGLAPIICVGERDESGSADAVAFCRDQVRAALAEAVVEPGTRIVVAYEPIWAIGAPAPAGPAHITAACRAIGEELTALVPEADTTVLYGGSAQPGMLAELDETVGGLFMGRSSHVVTNVAAVLTEIDGRLVA